MKKSMTHVAAAALAATLLAGIAACNGSGAGADGPITPASQATDQQLEVQVNLIASSTVLANDGLTPVDLTAIVTNSSGVAVASKAVSFTANDPGSGVRLEITQGTTDASGVATARLHLNGNPAARTVKVLAAVDQKTPSELPIEVAAASAGTGGIANNSRGQLTVRIGTDNLIEDLKEQLSYRKRYAVIVSDNAGIPKANATVLATLRARQYQVGFWTSCTGPNCGATKWVQYELSSGAGIASEDTSNFGTCDAGEDANGDKVLTPGNVASYTVSSQSDANGLAIINIVYPKSFAYWVVANLEVTAQVGGSEGFNALTIPLPMLAADVQGEVPPPAITRTRGSLSTPQMPFPISGTETTLFGAGFNDNTLVSGSPFPYMSQTPTCP